MVNFYLILEKNIYLKTLMYKIFIKKRQKVYEYLLATIFFPLSIIFVIAIRVIRPFFLIRYAYIISTRIGHLTENLDFYLCAKKEKIFSPNQKYLDIFYLNTYVCNKFFLKLLKKKIIIFPRFIMHPVDKINRFFDKFIDSEDVHTIGRYKKNLTLTPKPPWLNRDIYSFLRNHEPQFNFTFNEIEKGYSILNEMGINKSDKYVCLYSRDSKYLKTAYPSTNWSHHDHRDIDINHFIPSTKFLIDKGYKVVRIGNVVEKKMDFINKNFIDYPLTKYVQDFMDIFLQAKCSFTITTMSGIDNITSTFRKKLVFPCVCPIMDTKSSTEKHLVGYRHLIDKKTMKKLTLKEIIEKKLGYIFQDHEKIENIGLEEINPENLKEIVEEMVLRENNDYIETDTSKELEKNFFLLFKKFPKSNPIEGLWHPEDIKFKISHSFLYKNQWWLD
tara:strand:- start:107 stop:1438 length:1332 start_codon:yes stop_codon:yes gene_type:complete